MLECFQAPELSHAGEEGSMLRPGLVQKGLPGRAFRSQPGDTDNTPGSKGYRRGKRPTGAGKQDLLRQVCLTLCWPRECKASLGQTHLIKNPPHLTGLDPALHPSGSGEEVLTPAPGEEGRHHASEVWVLREMGRSNC